MRHHGEFDGVDGPSLFSRPRSAQQFRSSSQHSSQPQSSPAGAQDGRLCSFPLKLYVLLFLAWYLSLLLINRLTLILSEKKSIPEHNNALLALLVSNNFAEIKSNVFKKVSKENLQNLVYYGECAYDCVISMILNQMLMDDCICYVFHCVDDPFEFIVAA